jgi:hypothetical protein
MEMQLIGSPLPYCQPSLPFITLLPVNFPRQATDMDRFVGGWARIVAARPGQLMDRKRGRVLFLVMRVEAKNNDYQLSPAPFRRSNGLPKPLF